MKKENTPHTLEEFNLLNRLGFLLEQELPKEEVSRAIEKVKQEILKDYNLKVN